MADTMAPVDAIIVGGGPTDGATFTGSDSGAFGSFEMTGTRAVRSRDQERG